MGAKDYLSHTKEQPLPRTAKNAKAASTSSEIRGPRAVYQVGYWSSLAAGFLAAAWPMTMVIQNVLHPPRPWTGIQEYAKHYNPIEMLNLVPSLPLASALLIMMAAVYSQATEEKKIWALLGLLFTVIYSVFASMNYLIQFIVVRPALLSGQIEGIAPYVMGNPASIFMALANSYTFLSIGMLFAAWVFGDSQLERWIRRLFLAVGIIAPIELAHTFFNLSLWVGLPVIAAWSLAVPAASFLLAIFFQRELHKITLSRLAR